MQTTRGGGGGGAIPTCPNGWIRLGGAPDGGGGVKIRRGFEDFLQLDGGFPGHSLLNIFLHTAELCEYNVGLFVIESRTL